MGGWVGWLEKWGLKLISTQVVVEVEVVVELGKKPLMEPFVMNIYGHVYFKPNYSFIELGQAQSKLIFSIF